MAKCSSCGKSLGFFSSSSMCADCTARRRAVEHKRNKQAQEEYLARRAELALAEAQALKLRIQNGDKLILYEDVYLPVDSQIVDETMNSEFTIGLVRRMGLDGWKVVATIPRTVGIALTNTSSGSSSGETWGAGVGGNVVGVHVIFEKEVSAQNNVSDEFLERYVLRNLNDFVSESG